MVVKELSGDWFNEIACEDIQAESRFFFDELVYFGDAADLERGAGFDYLIQASMTDRYNYDHQRVGFYYNTSEECHESHGHDSKKKHIAIFNGDNSLPITIEIDF